MRSPVRFWPASLVCITLAPCLAAQSPDPPPRPLPPSITGVAPVTPPVNPVSGVQTQSSAATPVARFQNLQAFPPDTVQAVYSVWSGANWLSRMNQANGRFLPGLNPTLRVPVSDDELRQAHAARALAEVARFTGKEEFAARSTQAVLALLTLTRPDPAEPTRRVPDVPPERCNRTAFAAVLVLAIYALPSPDAKLLAQAEELCAFLRTRCNGDGSIQTLDTPADDPTKVDPDAATVYPGLVIQALSASYRAKPDAGKRDAIARAIGHYRSAFKARPTAMLAATLIPGFVDFCLQSGNDSAVATAVYEMADWLCGCQYTRADARHGAWLGGFRPSQLPEHLSAEPGAEGAICATALASAVKLTRHVPDLSRFHRYRQATVAGLAFVRRLQFSDENADHFEKVFRTRFLVGGVHLTPSDGTVRLDAAAHLLIAQLTYLQSGAEAQAD
jgi:hypothetical protein